MRPAPACLVAALLTAPSLAAAEPPRRGIDGTTVVHGVDALPDHVLIVMSAWCLSVDDAEQRRLGDDFNGEPDQPPTVGNNFYGCTYQVVRSGEGVTYDAPTTGQQIPGAPWHAPKARDDIFYALPRAKFPGDKYAIPTLDSIPLSEFAARLSHGKDGVLQASIGPTRGFEVPADSDLVGFQDVLRAQIDGGTFTLTPVQRSLKHTDGRVTVEPLGAAIKEPPPAQPSPGPVPEARPEPVPSPVPAARSEPPAPSPVPEARSEPASPVPEVGHEPVSPIPEARHEPSPVPPPLQPPTTATAPATPPTTPRAGPPLVHDLALAGGSLALGLLMGVALRRRPAAGRR